MKSKFITEFLNRLTLEAPSFHQKLIGFGKWLLAVSIALTGLPAGYEMVFPNADMDLSLLGSISSYAGLAGLIISIVAGTAVKNPDYSKIDKKR